MDQLMANPWAFGSAGVAYAKSQCRSMNFMCNGGSQEYLSIYPQLMSYGKKVDIKDLPHDVKFVSGYDGDEFDGPLKKGTLKPKEFQDIGKGPYFHVAHFDKEKNMVIYHHQTNKNYDISFDDIDNNDVLLY